MSDKVDAILASGCLEKLLEEGAPEIKDKEGMISYLAENGFTDLSITDLPSNLLYCLGTLLPNLLPAPAAAIITNKLFIFFIFYILILKRNKFLIFIGKI